MHSLGYCLMYGVGTAVDERRALHLYKQAAKQNHAPAQLSLGRCYLNAVGTLTPNERLAYKWIKRASLNGNDLATLQLGQVCAKLVCLL